MFLQGSHPFGTGCLGRNASRSPFEACAWRRRWFGPALHHISLDWSRRPCSGCASFFAFFSLLPYVHCSVSPPDSECPPTGLPCSIRSATTSCPDNTDLAQSKQVSPS